MMNSQLLLQKDSLLRKENAAAFKLTPQYDPNITAVNHDFSQPLAALNSPTLKLSRVLNSHANLEQQLTTLLNETVRILDAQFAVFYLLNERRKEIWPHFVSNGKLKQHRQPLGGGIAEYVLQNGKIVNVTDAYDDPRYQAEVDRFGKMSVRSFLIVPMNNRNGKISGCLQVVNKREGAFDQKDTQNLMFIADLIAMAIQNDLVKKQARECKRLESEISRAVDIQRQLLPGKVPQVPGYEMFAFNKPSKFVGGDYYDFFPFPRTMSFVLADVSGKGVPAALLTANLHASLHAYASELNTCKEIVKKINHHFHLYTAPDMFATFFWGDLNHNTHRFKYVNAGHVPPIFIKKDGSSTKLKSSGLPIGILDTFEYKQTEIKFSRGDMMILFSDGITEVANMQNEQFGKKKLAEIVQQNYHLPSKELGKLLLQEVRRHARSSSYPDDMTLMIIKRNLN